MRPEHLSNERLTKQYENADKLSARIALHARYSQSPVNWMDWVFDRLALPEGARVLEVGCGTALLWRHNAARLPESWRLTLTDRSPGMLAEGRALLAAAAPAVAARAVFAVADAESLPFGAAHFDAVIANHMLYHVPDRARALAEFRRVLVPGGALFAATNGARHMEEVRAPEISALLYPNGFPSDPAFRTEGMPDWFALENGGGEIAAVFGNCTIDLFEDELRVTDARDLAAYHTSYVDLSPAQLERVLAHYDGLRDDDGAVRITKSSGLFEARR